MRALSVAAAILSLAGMATPADAEAQTLNAAPTFNEDVGTILLDNCANCHRPNQVAPMSLLSYMDVRPWARAIKAKVEAREMPPWFADPRFGTFSNDPSLSDDEIATIVAWVDAGAPEGDGVAPEPPQFSDAGWNHPSGLAPDFVYEFPIEWHVDAEGDIPNFNLYTPIPFDDVMWVSAADVHPGNFSTTHHVLTRLVNIAPGKRVGHGPVWPGGPTADYALVPDPDADQEERARLRRKAEKSADDGENGFASGFGAYVPGRGPAIEREGQVRALRGDLFSHIEWNLHFQATGRPEMSRPAVGAWIAPEPDNVKLARRLPLQEYTSEGKTLVAPPPLSDDEAREAADGRQPGQNLNPLLDPIPPHRANWTVTGIGAFEENAILQDLYAHAHLRGKDFTYVLTYPDGREEILLRIPNFSFDWQYVYDLADPIFVPAGSTLKAISRYDNSRANRVNPAPHKPTYWAEQSWDDMFVALAGYTLAEEGQTGAGEN